MKAFAIPAKYPGRLAIATRPRGGEWIENDMMLFVRGGWQVLISTLEYDEVRELALVGEQSMAEEKGVTFISFPIKDRGTPGVAKAMELVLSIKSLLLAGSHVAVHCRMGIGRSGLICAATMVALGAMPDSAWATLSSVRVVAVPDTEEQRRWLEVFRRALEPRR